jgi:hypothetical protein
VASIVFALTRQQPFAQHPLRSLKKAPLREVVVIRNEYVAYVVRVVEQVKVLGSDAKMDDVAIAFGKTAEISKWVTA